MIPVDKFGIVAAMSRNRVIGVDGALPWKLPADRMYFKHLTNGKALILGRRTLLEDSELRHIAHASRVIVLSRTLAEADLTALQADHSDLSLSFSLARSFPAALDLARRLEREKEPDESTKGGSASANQIECWVVGGERVYQEAILHPSADQLHLTVVDIDVDERNLTNGSIARFPAKYRWDNKFQLLSSAPESDAGTGLSYRIDVYRRLKGRR
jgi:dihydrofolate reductase